MNLYKITFGAPCAAIKYFTAISIEDAISKGHEYMLKKERVTVPIIAAEYVGQYCEGIK